MRYEMVPTQIDVTSALVYEDGTEHPAVFSVSIPREESSDAVEVTRQAVRELLDSLSETCAKDVRRSV